MRGTEVPVPSVPMDVPSEKAKNLTVLTPSGSIKNSE